MRQESVLEANDREAFRPQAPAAGAGAIRISRCALLPFIDRDCYLVLPDY